MPLPVIDPIDTDSDASAPHALETTTLYNLPAGKLEDSYCEYPRINP